MAVREPGRGRISRDGAVAALTSLSVLAEASVTGVMVISQHADNSTDVAQLVPTSRALPALNGVIRAAASKFAESEVIDYGPSALTVEGQVMWLSVDAVPLLQAIADEAADLADLPEFDPGDAALREVQLGAMSAESNGSTAVFVQSLRGNQVVAQSTRLGVIIRRGVLDLPPRGHMVLFRRDVAAIIVDGVVFFRDRPAFQRLFGYLEELRQQASATFESVTVDLRIAGMEQMAQAVTGSPAMLGKMASIQRKLEQYPQYRAALTMPRLVAFVQTHPECGVEIEGEGDAVQLVFRNDPQHRFKILKLLDDDYLRSELTALEYEANSKSAPIG